MGDSWTSLQAAACQLVILDDDDDPGGQAGKGAAHCGAWRPDTQSGDLRYLFDVAEWVPSTKA